jgi:hypothetical protein
MGREHPHQLCEVVAHTSPVHLLVERAAILPVADPPLPPGRRGMQSLAATAPSSVASDSIAPATGQQRSVRNRIVFIWIC